MFHGKKLQIERMVSMSNKKNRVLTRRNLLASMGLAGASLLATGTILPPATAATSSSMINVKDFGAIGDGVADDTASVNNAISNLPLSGGVLYFPSGRYKINNPISISNKDVTIKGDGIQLSQLFFPMSNGITYTTNNLFNDALQVQDLSLVTISNNSYKGIVVSIPSNQGSAWKNLIIERVYLSGSTSIEEYNNGTNGSQTGINKWLTAIELSNCGVSHIRDCVVRSGPYSSSNGVGIELLGYTVDILITGCKFYGTGISIRKNGPAEGIIIDNCMGINVGSFLVINSSSNNLNGVYASVHNCHINYFENGMNINYHPQIFIDKCLMYKNGPSSGTFDIIINRCDRSRITNSSLIVHASTGTSNGIAVAGTNTCLIQGNIIQERETGV